MLEHSLTARIPLLTATGAFGLGRRRDFSSTVLPTLSPYRLYLFSEFHKKYIRKFLVILLTNKLRDKQTDKHGSTQYLHQKPVVKVNRPITVIYFVHFD